MVPNKTGYVNISPREAFTGRKINYLKDIRVGFGDYAQVKSNNPITNNNEARSESAIALLPVGNTQGSVKFYSIRSGRIFTRDQFTILPTPQEVVQVMNALADKDKVRSDGNIDVRNSKNLPIMDMEQIIQSDVQDMDVGLDHPIQIQNADKVLDTNTDIQAVITKADSIISNNNAINNVDTYDITSNSYADEVVQNNNHETIYDNMSKKDNITDTSDIQLESTSTLDQGDSETPIDGTCIRDADSPPIESPYLKRKCPRQE
jgi:hypothetical protein